MSLQIATALAIFGTALFLWVVIRVGLELRVVRERDRGLKAFTASPHEHQELIDVLYIEAHKVRILCERSDLESWDAAMTLQDALDGALERATRALMDDDKTAVLKLHEALVDLLGRWTDAPTGLIENAGQLNQL